MCFAMQNTSLTSPTSGSTRFSVTTSTGKTVEVDSPFTDTEARQLIADAPDKSDFEKSLLAAPKLSFKQRAWVHICAVRRTEAAKKPVPQGTALGGDFNRIATMFAKAGQTLQFPKIHLASKHEHIRLHVFGMNSKYTGQICVKTESGQYLGRIDKTGNLFASHVADDVMDTLKRFATNPEKVASEYGKLTGHCCFCMRALSDTRSTEVGYGPVCADKFGLAWG